MSELSGKVAVVTGAGRGIGRAHALALAAAGASVVVNDPGVARDGSGRDDAPADEVVRAICEAGGAAIASRADCADWEGAAGLVETAREAFGGFDILVNNAGILRDRMSFNMTEEEFDAVTRVHLKGHFAPARHAAAFWRAEAKAGRSVAGRIINTTSESGLYGAAGQANYAAAKAGIAALTITMARELAALSVTVNAISPRAVTRFTEGIGGATPTAPESVSPMVVYLASDEAASITGQVFIVHGGHLALAKGWRVERAVDQDRAFAARDMRGAVETLFAAGAARTPEGMPA